jgi:hypothetical protein
VARKRRTVEAAYCEDCNNYQNALNGAREHAKV